MPDRTNRGSRGGGEANKESRFSGGLWRRGKSPSSSIQPGSDCYLQRAHDLRHLLSGEWVWDVLVALVDGPLQYTVLLDAIRSRQSGTCWPGRKHHYLRDGTLNRTLRRLEQGELVTHDREADFPYHSAYALTPAAKELLAMMVPLVEWAESNADLLERVRQRRHAEEADNG
ncbi:winged helix-turn-helix transcriptional regulator [Streptomyces sp. NPDC001401]|uniref:winged helix-turn-helix transcriptional regulator n=1 Tax=Streptomyces sp. NPDC001401 TaxID=3364570 RepID=UPI0036BBF6D3